MIPRLTAVHFHHFMGSGRTSPALCGCEEAVGNVLGDFVVKLRGGIERGDEGMQCELMASWFAIDVPEPAFVTTEEDLAELIAESRPSKAARIRGRIGLNDQRLKPVESATTESRRIRLKPSEGCPAESRLKAPWAR